MAPDGSAGSGVAEWTAAGLYDPEAVQAPDRLALLSFLVEQGCSLSEMVEAEGRDRLFALAGDRIIRPPWPRYDLTAAAAALDADEATLARAWRSFGLPTPTGEVFGAADLEALRTWLDVREMLGEAGAVGMSRVIGAGMGRLAEAESAAMRVGLDGQVDRGHTGSEVTTGRAYALVAEMVPRIGNVLDTVHRHHIEAARRHFELVAPGYDDALRCGVGFADLSDFTQMSQEMPLAALSVLLAEFDHASSETVADGGGRVVKFLGDAVMYVAPTTGALAGIALDLVHHPKAAVAGLRVRAGIAFGDLLAQDGDYFGPPVNLAARLVAAAEPGEVLAEPGLAPLLGPDFLLEEREPRLLRGIEVAVAPFAVRRSDALG